MPGEEIKAFAQGRRETLEEAEVRQQESRASNCDREPPRWKVWDSASTFQ